jgi:hypothetical protein
MVRYRVSAKVNIFLECKTCVNEPVVHLLRDLLYNGRIYPLRGAQNLQGIVKVRACVKVFLNYIAKFITVISEAVFFKLIPQITV